MAVQVKWRTIGELVFEAECGMMPIAKCPTANIAAIITLEHNAAIEKHPAMLALENLTPGGSEYVNDVERCVAAIKETRTQLMDNMRKFKIQRDALLAACKIGLEFAESDWGAPTMDDTLTELRAAIAKAEAGQ
jgi:hypothetical protein